MYQKIIALFIFFLFAQASLQGQLVTTHYGLQEGLPSSETFFGYQDDSSYLWFTTDRGVVKYDGYDFKTYTTNDGLAELVNLKILEDPAGGFVLMGKNSKVTFYKEGDFIPFRFNEEISKLQDSIGDRLDILDISKEYILLNNIGSEDQFIEISRLSGNIKLYALNELSNIGWSSISNIELPQIQTEIPRLRIIRCPSTYYSQYIIELEEKTWLYSITGQDTKITKLPYSTTFAYLDNKNSLWYNYGGKLSKKTANNNQSLKILDREISSTYEDTDGNIWAFTPGEGLYKIRHNTFLNKLKIPGFNTRVIDIYTKANLVKLYTTSSGEQYKFYIKDSMIYSDFNKIGYIFNYKQVLDSFSLGNRFRFAQIDSSLKKIENLFDYTVLINFEDEKNHFVFEKNGDVFTVVNGRTVKQNIEYTYDFLKFNDEYLFGTTEGLKIGQFNHSDNHSITISDTTYINNRINDLDKGVNGDVWIATLEKGIYRYNNNRVSKIINPFHQFNSINTVEVLDTIAFIGTSSGINKVVFKLENDSVIIKKSEVLGVAGGLSPPYVKSLEYYKDHLYVGTLQGVFTFHVDSFQLTESKPNIYIKGLYQRNQKLNAKEDQSIDLKRSDNFFTIQYTGISYSKDPVIPFYRYSFHANDSTHWVYTQSRELNFSDIAPGDYTFSVQCRNNANQWSEPATLFLSVQPPFFQSWTFRIGSILLLGGLIWTFFYFRSRRLKRQQAIKNEILSVQMQSTRSQMNPHFVFNGMNAIQNFIFSGDKEGANRYLSTFSSLLRDSLQMANREYISLDQEVSFVKRYLNLEKERFSDKFDYKVTVETQIPREKVLVPTLMVQTLAENAVKHAFKGNNKKGNINIHYHYNDELKLLTIKVVDDGVGLLNRSQNKKYDADKTSYGLNLLKRRIDIYNERTLDKRKAAVNVAYLYTEQKTGTIITLNIPLNGTEN